MALSAVTYRSGNVNNRFLLYRVSASDSSRSMSNCSVGYSGLEVARVLYSCFQN